MDNSLQQDENKSPARRCKRLDYMPRAVSPQAMRLAREIKISLSLRSCYLSPSTIATPRRTRTICLLPIPTSSSTSSSPPHSRHLPTSPLLCFFVLPKTPPTPLSLSRSVPLVILLLIDHAIHPASAATSSSDPSATASPTTNNAARLDHLLNA